MEELDDFLELDLGLEMGTFQGQIIGDPEFESIGKSTAH